MLTIRQHSGLLPFKRPLRMNINNPELDYRNWEPGILLLHTSARWLSKSKFWPVPENDKGHHDVWESATQWATALTLSCTAKIAKYNALAKILPYDPTICTWRAINWHRLSYKTVMRPWITCVYTVYRYIYSYNKKKKEIDSIMQLKGIQHIVRQSKSMTALVLLRKDVL